MSTLRRLAEQKDVLIVSAILALVVEVPLVAIVFLADWFGYSHIGHDVTHLLARKVGEMTLPLRHDCGIDPSGATLIQFLVILGVGYPMFFGLMLWQCGNPDESESG